MIKTNKITHLLPVFCIINLNIVSWTFLCYFPSHSEEFDSFEKVDSNINLHGDYKSYENFEFFLKIYEIFKFYEIFEILNFFEIFEIFFLISEFS